MAAWRCCCCSCAGAARRAGRAERGRPGHPGPQDRVPVRWASTRSQEKDLRPHIALTARGGMVGLRRALGVPAVRRPGGRPSLPPGRAAARRGPAPEHLHPLRVPRRQGGLRRPLRREGGSGGRHLRDRGGPAAPAPDGAVRRPATAAPPADRARARGANGREFVRAGAGGTAAASARASGAESPTAPPGGSGTAAIRSPPRRRTCWWTPPRTGPTSWSG